VKVVAVIPSRFGSSRFEGKPLASVAGKPMIQRVYELAMQAQSVHEVAVATDHEAIYDLVVSFGGRVIMTAPEHRSGTDRIAEAVGSMGLEGNDIVINIQGDQPNFPPPILDQVVRPLLESPDLLMATLVNRMNDPSEISHPNFVKTVMDHEGFAIYFSRSVIPFSRQGLEHAAYFKHLGFYSYRRHFLKTFTALPEGALEAAEKLEQLRALEFGYKIKVVETEYDSIEVDTPEDARKAENMILSSGAA
jgi:3-deoxy-manno-octulosonate cytidylyltransferase (CMP-KDO synthetase)